MKAAAKNSTRARGLRRLPKAMILRGRSFSKSELTLVRDTVRAKFSAGRWRISILVCELLDWKQPNGWLKDRACRDVLRKLDALGYIRLPPSKTPQQKRPKATAQITPPEVVPAKPVRTIRSPISLRVAKGNDDERKWNSLVQQHHYLGHSVTVGRNLKFLVCSGENILGAVSLAEAAYAVADRDCAIAQLGIARQSVANNSRFLLLPHVKVKNLASQVLALLATDGAAKWKEYYCTELQCLETFVDGSRFKGTSYRAANWILVGKSKGYRKCGSRHHNSQTPKMVFLYPLSRKARKRLLRVAISKEQLKHDA